jgi:hypothetical protein
MVGTSPRPAIEVSCGDVRDADQRLEQVGGAENKHHWSCISLTSNFTSGMPTLMPSSPRWKGVKQRAVFGLRDIVGLVNLALMCYQRTAQSTKMVFSRLE